MDRAQRRSRPTPDPADTLLHLCINQGLGGARRLRGLRRRRHRGSQWSLSTFPSLQNGPTRPAQHDCAQPCSSENRDDAAHVSAFSLRAFTDAVVAAIERCRGPMAGRHPNSHSGIVSGQLLSAGRRTRVGTLKALARSMSRDIVSPPRQARLGRCRRRARLAAGAGRRRRGRPPPPISPHRVDETAG